MLSPKFKRNASRILPFGLIWLVSGLVFLVVERGALQDMDLQNTSVIEMNFEIFVFSSLAITIVGLLVGTIELLFINRIFENKSFLKKILYKSLFYSLLLFLITIITFPIAVSMELQLNLLDIRVWEKLLAYLTSYTHISTDIQLASALVISLFYAEISENIGHGILLNFFTGKYHQPIEEKRIFMFLDMKSSTSIAEKIGHIQYFELLKTYYADLSEAIINCSGEIYQYVGDEIIVSWKLGKGVKNNNCVQCFYTMKADLKKQEEKYFQKFGLLPAFKAGFHIGRVTTGEIGAIKKEIIFTGDVLNTTSRIQSLCNDFQVDNLISKDLLQELELDKAFVVESLGINELKGKRKSIELFTLTKS